MEKSILLVIVLGVGMVFVGLISIIILCKLMGLVFARAAKKVSVAAAPVQKSEELSGKQRSEIVAAVSAAVAEELGTDVCALKIISFRKL